MRTRSPDNHNSQAHSDVMDQPVRTPEGRVPSDGPQGAEGCSFRADGYACRPGKIRDFTTTGSAPEDGTISPTSM